MINLLLAATLACNIAALTAAERKQHAVVTTRLFAAVIDRTDTADGFAFRLDRKRVSVADVREWIDKESRCCPFMKFAVATEPLTLRLSGGKGVKQFIASAFASANPTRPVSRSRQRP